MPRIPIPRPAIFPQEKQQIPPLLIDIRLLITTQNTILLHITYTNATSSIKRLAFSPTTLQTSIFK